jgi:hypothetical protein
MPSQAELAAAGGGDVGLALLVTLVNLCWLFVGFGALVASASAAYVDGRALEPADAMRRALRRAWTLVAAHLFAMLIVFGIVVGVLFALMVVAGIAAGVIGAFTGTVGELNAAAIGVIVTVVLVALMLVGSLLAYARFVNVTALVMLEGLGVGGALKRSSALVRGSLGRTIGVVAIMWVLYLVVYLSLWAVAALFVRSMEVSSNVATALAVAAYPFLASLLALLYYDLRIRREGYDLELMARALGETPAAEAPV